MKHGIVLKGKDNSFVCNTADSHSEGEHWIAIYINSIGCGEYFDSYGFGPNRVFKDFLETYSHNWTYNTISLQTPLTTVCGQYCVCWLHAKGQGYDSETIIDNLNVCNSDKHVLDFVNKHFNGITKRQLIDRRFMRDQIAKALSLY